MLPPDIGSLIPDNHLVRTVDKVINELKLAPLFDTYKGGGTSSYSPRIMLKYSPMHILRGSTLLRRIAEGIKGEHKFYVDKWDEYS